MNVKFEILGFGITQKISLLSLAERAGVRGIKINCSPPPLPTGRQAHPPHQGEGVAIIFMVRG